MIHGSGVTIIEWADKILPLLPSTAITVAIRGLGDEPREIELDGPEAILSWASS
jgi:tRNA A37 threonylcarbamoyladenosine biosynthesis protein TsaE